MVSCGHSFSEETLEGWKLKGDGEAKCPVCNTPIHEEDIRPNFKVGSLSKISQNQALILN